MLNNEKHAIKTPVVSFVAWSGTGKTTLIEKLIPELKSRGLRVAVIKHDAHNFDVDKQGKDTYRFTAAGADSVAITSATKAAVMVSHGLEPEEIVEMFPECDLVLTEGFKAGGFPKIAISRAEIGGGFPVGENQCIAFVTDEQVPESKIPVFHIDDAAGVAEFLIQTFLPGCGA
ncbi:MAG: molybdopterin-guanine dinucleotide biosynthesis protein B [Oscillospiraceae bacterium]|jgi:molybdopterin-guanine dinucleotide biosynthesis protein A/molybdopterin-guanine dinucleotide biosynthesis protein|nr:molybdopterin-guanine dinucleotide biosynthesis protein B [Oscillospiraceae bacterium]